MYVRPVDPDGGATDEQIASARRPGARGDRRPHRRLREPPMSDPTRWRVAPGPAEPRGAPGPESTTRVDGVRRSAATTGPVSRDSSRPPASRAARSTCTSTARRPSSPSCWTTSCARCVRTSSGWTFAPGGADARAAAPDRRATAEHRQQPAPHPHHLPRGGGAGRRRRRAARRVRRPAVRVRRQLPAARRVVGDRPAARRRCLRGGRGRRPAGDGLRYVVRDDAELDLDAVAAAVIDQHLRGLLNRP